MLHAALFDFDGTIVDSLAHIHSTWKAALQRQQFNLTDEEINQHILYTTREEKVALYPTLDVDGLHADYRVVASETLRELTVHEHVDAVLGALQAQGLKIGVVTFSRRERVEEILRALNLVKYFDAILGSDDVARPKPHPDIVFKAMETFGVTAEQTVLIGDSVMDMKTGKNAGVFTALYVPESNAPYNDHAASKALMPDIEFAHYSELLPKLQDLAVQ